MAFKIVAFCPCAYKRALGQVDCNRLFRRKSISPGTTVALAPNVMEIVAASTHAHVGLMPRKYAVLLNRRSQFQTPERPAKFVSSSKMMVAPAPRS